MIKALLFDLGDVIIGLDFERAYRKIEGLSRLWQRPRTRHVNGCCPR